MKIKVEKTGACRRKVSVSAPVETVRPVYERAVRMFVKHARIPGFRPGKAPAELVENRFRKDILKQTQDDLLPEVYQQMLEKESLSPVAVLDVEGVRLSLDEGFSFSVTVDVPPEFKLPKYQKIPLEAPDVTVSDEDVDRALAGVRRRLARYEDVTEGEVQDQDLVKVTYAGTYEGQPLAEAFNDVGELASGEDFWIPIVAESEFLPGLNAALTGAAVGARLERTVEFPADYRVNALAGRNVDYTFTIQGLRRLCEPELDEAFLKETGMESLDALRQRLREDLEAEKKTAEDQRQRQDIARFLVEHTKIEVPESQVGSETSTLLRSLLTRLAHAGGTREMLEKHRDEIMGSVTRDAASRVKLKYIVKAIAEAEHLSIEDDAVDREIERLAGQYRMPPEKLRAEIAKAEDGEQRLRDDLLQEKVMEVLLATARIK